MVILLAGIIGDKNQLIALLDFLIHGLLGWTHQEMRVEVLFLVFELTPSARGEPSDQFFTKRV